MASPLEIIIMYTWETLPLWYYEMSQYSRILFLIRHGLK